jgi:hypothetical protein
MAINKLMVANIKAGDDLIKLSLILIRTIKPASINKHNPAEDNSNIMG